ncbi:MAG: hypothetical protein U1F40_06190 [Turneriella sp.]
MKSAHAVLTEIRVHKVEKLLNVDNLYARRMSSSCRITQCLKSTRALHRDVDCHYRGEIIIVDQVYRPPDGRSTGGNGLRRQSKTKKRSVKQENQTLATIVPELLPHVKTRRHGPSRSDAEAEEFREIYKLDVMVIPPNRKMIRKDFADKVYRTQREEFNAIADESKELHLGTAGAARYDIH